MPCVRARRAHAVREAHWVNLHHEQQGRREELCLWTAWANGCNYGGGWYHYSHPPVSGADSSSRARVQVRSRPAHQRYSKPIISKGLSVVQCRPVKILRSGAEYVQIGSGRKGTGETISAGSMPSLGSQTYASHNVPKLLSASFCETGRKAKFQWFQWWAGVRRGVLQTPKVLFFVVKVWMFPEQ